MTDRTDGSRSADPSDSPEAIPDTDPSDRSDDAGRSDDSGRPAAGSERPSDGPDGSPEGLRGWFVWFWTADSGSLVYLRDVVTSVVIVAGIGVLLFAASGVWPPMVAVESGSMEPNMERGDLVFIVDNDRFVPDGAVENAGEATGVVPADVAERHDRTKFGGHGDVVVFTPNGNDRQTPIIHRAMFWVEDGENWYDRADQAAIGGAADCEELNHCPAPHAGFITKGDNELTNANYDQTVAAVGAGPPRVDRRHRRASGPVSGPRSAAVLRRDGGPVRCRRGPGAGRGATDNRRRNDENGVGRGNDENGVEGGSRRRYSIRDSACERQSSARLRPTSAASATVSGSASASASTVPRPAARSRSAYVGPIPSMAS